MTKFNFQELSRENINGLRYYVTPNGEKLPSVTTILSDTIPQEKREILENWKTRVGKEKAQQITSEAAGVGTSMHRFLENYCQKVEIKVGSNLVHQQAYKMAKTIIDNGLIHMNECWGNEVSLYFPSLYAGSTDCVGLWKGKPAIIDFKQTNKPKKKEWISDYFLQLTAYGQAFTEVYNIPVETGVILMCSRDCEYQEFVIEGDEFKEWSYKWWDRVHEFYEKRIKGNEQLVCYETKQE